MKPRLLDGCCGAGGATKGYQWAGFEAHGIDIKNQPNYCGEQFTQADALAYLEWLITSGEIEQYDAAHFSPPCLGETTLKYLHSHKTYPDLIAPVRELLEASGLPYVIENVPHARRKLRNPVQLCGTSFGLGANGRELRRHRLFETNFPIMVPPCQHTRPVVGVYGTGGGGQMTRGYKGTPDEYREAMGIDWATRAEIAQAIPPAYAAHVGSFLIAAVNAPRELAA